VWILGVVAVLALFLSLATVAMVTTQWLMPADSDTNKCVCPTLDVYDVGDGDDKDPIFEVNQTS
jgi:hypothetical protein